MLDKRFKNCHSDTFKNNNSQTIWREIYYAKPFGTNPNKRLLEV